MKIHHGLGRRNAFTIMELIVVIAIIGLLIGLLMPAIQAARESANRTSCLNNLRQISIGLQLYEQSHGTLPPGFVQQMDADEPPVLELTGLTSVLLPNFFIWDAPQPVEKPDEAHVPGWGWAAHLLPYLEEKAVHKRINWSLSVEDEANAVARLTPVPTFNCASDPETGRFTVRDKDGAPIAEAATNSYTASFGSYGLINEQPDIGNGLFQRNSRHPFKSIVDGLGKTIAIGERGTILTQTPWSGVMTGGVCQTRVGAPVYISTTQKAPALVFARVGNRELNSAYSEPYDFFSPHPNAVQFAFADGSARPLSISTDLEALHAMATRNGNERVNIEQ